MVDNNPLVMSNYLRMTCIVGNNVSALYISVFREELLVEIYTN